MIQKCDFPGCEHTGTCRAPRDRTLKTFYHFCKAHAAEYNKNWNYFQNMTADEIDAEWEKETFGAPLKDKKQAAAETADYLDFLNGFLTGRGGFDKMRAPRRDAVPSAVVRAFKTFELPLTAGWKDVRIAYRRLAKIYHPDTARKLNARSAAEKFASIASAYQTLEKYFKK
ncbi:MAG: J domain-containing protein [Rickettsiales bacterium]|jgi:DnaJ-domain-containing protein 1|nr:J domain-containing protein [Rickettsiales bacterium]